MLSAISILVTSVGLWLVLAYVQGPSRREPKEPEFESAFSTYSLMEWTIPLVAWLNSLEHSLPGVGQVRAANVSSSGWIFRLLDFLDARAWRWLGMRIVRLPRASCAALVDQLKRRDAVDGGRSEKGIGLFWDALEQEHITASGRLMLGTLAKGLLNSRCGIAGYIDRNPEIREVRIERPVFILGCPRTASTLLHKLLAKDPDARSPKFWEMQIPVPAVKAETYETDPRIELARIGLESFEAVYPTYLEDMRKFHYVDHNEIDEDVVVLHYQLLFAMYVHVSKGNSGYENFVFEPQQDHAYAFHKQVLQLLSWKHPPSTHWLLKAPLHSLYIESLLKLYPDARIIVTHRSPLETVCSWTEFLCVHCDLFWTYPGIPKREKFEQTLRMMELMEERIQSCRKTAASAHPNVQWTDCDYGELIADPVGTAARIYRDLEMPFSDEAGDAMRTWTEGENSKRGGRVGKAKRKHSPQDYGFSDAEVLRRLPIWKRPGSK